MTVTTLKTKDNKGYTATEQGYSITVTIRGESELEELLGVVAPYAEYITYNEVTIR